MEKNNPFLVTGTQENQMTDKYFDSKNSMEWDIVEFHRFFIEKNKNRPEKLDYKTAADKLTRCLRDIVSTSVSADTIRQALILQEKLSNKRARRKGESLVKMWVSVEVELKEKKLTNLQLHGLLQATQESQNYAKKSSRSGESN
ncbi:unnamed protein product [Rhizophagus irregularis]|nr:unnamed protein product [Rhizophagus irregularis]